MSLYQNKVKKTDKSLSRISNLPKVDFCIEGDFFALKICFNVQSSLYKTEIL